MNTPGKDSPDELKKIGEGYLVGIDKKGEMHAMPATAYERRSTVGDSTKTSSGGYTQQGRDNYEKIFNADKNKN